mmetsp:Transcript_6704/g.18197  ORF Transcript_6704/g.18197 Transcript_6704/m.18197 type:complete len:232 (+) Transcript_6704:615-1310(+)
MAGVAILSGGCWSISLGVSGSRNPVCRMNAFLALSAARPFSVCPRPSIIDPAPKPTAIPDARPWCAYASIRPPPEWCEYVLAYMCGGMNPGSCVGIDAGTFLMAAETPPRPRPAASKWSWPESVGELPLRWPRMPCSIGRGRDVPKCGMDDASLSRRLMASPRSSSSTSTSTSCSSDSVSLVTRSSLSWEFNVLNISSSPNSSSSFEPATGCGVESSMLRCSFPLYDSLGR